MSSQSSVRSRLVRLLAVALIATAPALRAQSADATKPPPILTSAGQFSARRLSGPPAIDGQEWIAVEVQPTSDAGTITFSRPAFTLMLTDCGDHGDFQRCRLLFRREDVAPVPLDTGVTAWVFVTPDGRYLFTEPLYVLDVREWKQYALFEALQIRNYTFIEAISRDGKRLFISRRDCAYDCRGDLRMEYYELTLP